MAQYHKELQWSRWHKNSKVGVKVDDAAPTDSLQEKKQRPIVAENSSWFTE